METDILQQAKDIAEKLDNGILSQEGVAAILSKTPALASALAEIAKEDSRQHVEISKAELASFDKLTELMETVWKDPNATPEQKKAQCDAIQQQQDQLLGQKEQRESRHENRKDYLCYAIGGALILLVGIWIGVKKNNAVIVLR